MKIDDIAHKLADLTSGFSSSPENEKYLDSIRRIIGYNLRNNRQTISALKLRPVEIKLAPSKDIIQELSKHVVSKLPKEDRYLVQRIEGEDIVPVVGVQMGDVRLPINPFESPEEIRWNQKRFDQIGPFLSEEGRSIWFDLYYYEDKLTVRSQNGNIPYFLFSKARKNLWLDVLNSTKTVSLKPGHVWLLGKLLTNDAGNNEYIGFNIKGGSFSLSNTYTWKDQFLDFAGSFTGKLTLRLKQPEKNTANFEGCQAAQLIDFLYPDEVTFEWKNGQLTTIASDKGKFTGYGNDLLFSNMTLPAEYPGGLNHIFISCKVTPTQWQADFTQSRIFEADGNADIRQSFWALPIVRVTNPDTLGEPENSGGWGLKLSSDLSARWIGSDDQQPDAILNDALLLLYPQALFIYSEKATVNVTSSHEIEQTFSCWQISAENSARIPLTLNYRDKFPLIYYCHASDGETVLIGCKGRMQPDRPVYSEGSRITLDDLTGWVGFHSKAADIKINALLGSTDALQKPRKPLALENALMVVSQPTGLILEGTLSASTPNSIEKGQITLLHGLLRWKPILPDPYVSNLQGGWNIDRRPPTVHNPGASAFSSILFAQTSWEKPDKPIVTFKGNLPLASGIGIQDPSDPEVKSLPIQLDAKTLAEIKKHRINGNQKEEKKRIDSIFEQIERGLGGWKLLDVSTNMDLIGVSVSPSLFRERETLLATHAFGGEQASNKAFVVKGMAVNTPLSTVHVFTVPQVQWEPVRTLPEDQNLATLGWFPDNLSSVTDGGPTRLIGINQALSPIIPNIVVRQIKERFAEGSPAAALTTLSFGLKAIIQLSPHNTAKRNADSLDIVQPAFPQKKMQGGIQINLLAESGNPKFESPSPGFDGLMVQTLNGYELFTGTELGLSVLGATLRPDESVETQFNKEFGPLFPGEAPDKRKPFVPVTRFDLSGYGASNFSDWDNPEALAQIGKVQFKIMVGRTAFEVVKFVSKRYPDGTTMTRSVTIERRSGGGLIRKDSGWQPSGPGIFDFRVNGLPQPYTFRPGAIRGYFNTKNTRPASNDIIKFSDPSDSTIQVELAPVYFDADVQLDGQQNGNTFSKGILGFIQLSPKGKTLSVDAFKKLINDQGAVGGPIDTMLNVGSSGFNFRATRLEVDVTDNGGTPNFIGIVRGQPALPNNGSWSVVKMAAPGNTADPQEAVTSDVSRGTPLFIENLWLPPSGTMMNVSGPAGPYRFADPVDLFAPQPRFDYGFMQNTGSQAFLFRRPVIVSGRNEISSSLKPAFADLFAMTTSKGVFPPVTNAIEFPNANYKLLIQAVTGKLRLNSPVVLANMRPPLIVAQAGAGQWIVEYDQSQLKFNLNFDDWNVEFDTLSFWTSMAGITKLFGNRFSLRAGTAQQSKLINVQTLLKEEIRDILTFIPGMSQDQDIHDIDLGITNSKKETSFFWGLECGIEIDLKTGSVESKCKGLRGYEPGEEKKDEHHKSIEIKFKGAAAQGSMPGDESPPQLLAFAKLGIDFQAKLPIGGIWFIVLGLDWEAHWVIKPKPSESLVMKAYAGIGLGGYIGPFKAEAFIAGGIIIEIKKEPSVLWLVLLEAEIDLYIVSVSVNAELQGYVEADIGIASGEVAVNVCIFLVINISASYEYEEEKQLSYF
jgi:hypothetical protein